MNSDWTRFTPWLDDGTYVARSTSILYPPSGDCGSTSMRLSLLLTHGDLWKIPYVFRYSGVDAGVFPVRSLLCEMAVRAAGSLRLEPSGFLISNQLFVDGTDSRTLRGIFVGVNAYDGSNYGMSTYVLNGPSADAINEHGPTWHQGVPFPDYLTNYWRQFQLHITTSQYQYDQWSGIKIMCRHYPNTWGYTSVSNPGSAGWSTWYQLALLDLTSPTFLNYSASVDTVTNITTNGFYIYYGHYINGYVTADSEGVQFDRIKIQLLA